MYSKFREYNEMSRFITKLLFLLYLLCIGTKSADAQEFKYYKGMLTMPYKETFFHQESSSGNALVIYLHPRSARGHNNETQERVAAYKILKNYLDASEMKAVLLAPQCEESRHWNEYSAPIGKYLSDVVKDLIDDYVSKHDIDKSRIYILGESFGASGVWRLVTDYPNFFAAAMPAVCSPKLKNLNKYVNIKKASKTPLCIVTGANDEVYGPEVMAPYIEELQSRKCDLNYVILPDANHYDACIRPFPTEALDWLFNHKQM